MKRVYPNYKGINIRTFFNSLSKNNQKIINDYINYCRTDAKETTLQKYFNKIVQIADVLQKPLDKLVLKDVHNYLALLNTSDRSTDTVNDLKKTLKRFIRWKYDDWVKDFKGLKDVRQRKKGTSEKLSKKDLLTKEDLEMLIRGAESLRYKAMIMLMYETAARPQEIFEASWNSIDFQNKEFTLKSSKTGNSRVVPIEESIIHLKRYYQEYPFPDVQDSDFIFPATDRTKPINTQVVNDYLKKLSLRTIKKKLYPYIIRHTRLQEIRPKLSVEAYEKIAGHSMEVALQHYGHMENSEAKEEMISKIYHIEELTKEEKDEIKKMKKQLEQMKKAMQLQLIESDQRYEKFLDDLPVYLAKVREKLEVKA